MENLLDKFGHMAQLLVTQILSVGKEYGPQALELILNAVRIDCAATLLTGIICIIAALGVFKYALRPFHRYMVDKNNNETICGGHDFLYGALILALIIPTVVGGARVFNLWNYVGVVKPELYIVKKAMDGVLNQADKKL